MSINPTAKCTIDLSGEDFPPSKRVKKEEAESQEWNLFFCNIFLNVQGVSAAKLVEVVNNLSAQEWIFAPFHLNSLHKLRSAFDRFLTEQDSPKETSASAHQVLTLLYALSLENGQIGHRLTEINKRLPELRNQLEEAPAVKVDQVLQRANRWLQDKGDLSSLKTIIADLRPWHLLSSYDEEEATKVVDLAKLLAGRPNTQHYPQVITDYPKLQKVMQTLPHKKIRETMRALMREKQALEQQKLHSSQQTTLNEVDGRLIIPFGTILYNVAAYCVWRCVQKEKVNNINYEAVNKAWEKVVYDTGFSFDDWIRLELQRTQLNLQQLEVALQEKSADINRIRADSELDKMTKELLAAEYTIQMQALCSPLFPEFEGLEQLRSYLVQRVRAAIAVSHKDAFHKSALSYFWRLFQHTFQTTPHFKNSLRAMPSDMQAIPKEIDDHWIQTFWLHYMKDSGLSFADWEKGLLDQVAPVALFELYGKESDPKLTELCYYVLPRKEVHLNALLQRLIDR